MNNIHYYENIIKEKRKNTSWRDFIKELGSWRVFNLYKQNSRICRYPKSNRIKKLGDNFWEDACNTKKDYDSNRSFFENFYSFSDIIAYSYTMNIGINENCEYTDGVLSGKNVYLSFAVGLEAKNILYSAFSYINISDIINSFLVTKNSNNIANSHGITESYNIFYSKNITNSSNIWFSTNCIGCNECIGCDNLENVSYFINNKQYTKNEYLEKKKEILKDKKSFNDIWKYIKNNQIINIGSKNVKGIGITKSSNIENGLWIANMHDSRNIVIGNGDPGSKNILDGINIGVNSQDMYYVIGTGLNSNNIYCSMGTISSSNIYYSSHIQDCSFCFGCIGLKNKSYCILNKQYSKDEWEKKVCEIFASMEIDGTIGKFFPASMNPYYFNDTLAYVIDDSFTKEEVEKEGYMWRDNPIQADIPKDMEVIESKNLSSFQGFDSDGNWKINPEILNKVIKDNKGNYYRIVQIEYDFLMKHGLPLPEIHWLDRIKMGFR